MPIHKISGGLGGPLTPRRFLGGSAGALTDMPTFLAGYKNNSCNQITQVAVGSDRSEAGHW